GDVTTTVKPTRSAGILLHPSSLPGPYGIGDFGTPAFHWIDALAHARQKYWQILPLGPTGYGDSPYQSFSAFAGNPYLISPELLLREGLLLKEDVTGASFPAEHVDYGPVIQFKVHVLARAWHNFQGGAAPSVKPLFEEFCKLQAAWLDDFALYMAIKHAHGGASWQDWPREYRLRRPESLAQARRVLADSIGRTQFGQFLFFRQWREVKKYANDRGIRLIGDMPIFVSADSADLWANPELYQLDEQRRPKVVAGVPPDY